MNFFMELDLAGVTWWAKDRVKILSGYMSIMTMFFISAVICILSFNAPPLELDSYLAGFVGYIFGYYLDVIIGEIMCLGRKLFKKGESK